MNRTLLGRLLCLVVVAVALTPTAGAQSAKGLLDKMLEVESKRARGVDDYAMDITMMGHDSTLFYERVSMGAPNGKPIETFRLVSFDEMRRRQEAGQGMSPEAWQAYSKGLEQTGAAVGSETEKGMTEAGLPQGMLGAMEEGASAEPWASPNPSTMMSSMAVFARAAGDASTADRAGADDAAMAKSMGLFRKRATIVGKESIGKRSAIHMRAADLNLREKTDGGEIIIDSVSLWVDAKMHVPLKLRMEGVTKQNGESQEIVIERFDQDYRTVPGSKLYMPYRGMVRMKGVLGPDQQKQMQDARKQLAELDQQLAEMPPEQRAQVERMAGSQITMLRKMVNSGEMDVVTEVRAIRVNTGLSGAFGAGTPPRASPSPPSTPPSPTGDPLVKAIQQDLVALGYDPGNTHGDLSTPTVVAISKFQAENNLEVTGAATPQLAGILAAKRDAAASATRSSPSAETLEQAQAACLQEKIDAAKKKKKAFGRFMKAAADTTSRYAGTKVSSEVEKASAEAYKADATAKDVEEAAVALGLSEADIESCRKPK
jgi:peptidoglycan hydrolase-like protein with peptidoglycan-binding domain